MSYFVRDTVALEAAAGTASSNVTDFTGAFTGQIWAVGYYAIAPVFESTFTVTLTLEKTSQTILSGIPVTTSLQWFYPRGQVHNTTGGGTSFGTTGLGLIRDKFSVANERIKIVIDGTSNITTGQSGVCVVVVEGTLSP